MDAIPTQQLVSSSRILEILFQDDSRPSERWLRNQIRAGSIPYYKIGRLVRFDTSEVRAALRKNLHVEAKGL